MHLAITKHIGLADTAEAFDETTNFHSRYILGIAKCKNGIFIILDTGIIIVGEKGDIPGDSFGIA